MASLLLITAISAAILGQSAGTRRPSSRSWLADLPPEYQDIVGAPSPTHSTAELDEAEIMQPNAERASLLEKQLAPFIEAVGRDMNPDLRFVYYGGKGCEKANDCSARRANLFLAKMTGKSNTRVAMKRLQAALDASVAPEQAVELISRNSQSPMVKFCAQLRKALFADTEAVNAYRPTDATTVHLSACLRKLTVREEGVEQFEYWATVVVHATEVPCFLGAQQHVLEKIEFSQILNTNVNVRGQIRVHPECRGPLPLMATPPICVPADKRDFIFRDLLPVDHLPAAAATTVAAELRRYGRVDLYANCSITFNQAEWRDEFSFCISIAGPADSSNSGSPTVVYVNVP